MTEIDVTRFREADKVVQTTIDRISLIVKRHYEANNVIKVSVKQNSLDDIKHGFMRSFKDVFEENALSFEVEFSIDEKTSGYGIVCPKLSQRFMVPVGDFKFEGTLEVHFVEEVTGNGFVKEILI